MGKGSKSLGEDGDGVIDEVGEAEVVNGEDEKGMDVGVEAGNVGGKDGDGLRCGNELSRLCLGQFCHIRPSIVTFFVVS